MPSMAQNALFHGKTNEPYSSTLIVCGMPSDKNMSLPLCLSSERFYNKKCDYRETI